MQSAPLSLAMGISLLVSLGAGAATRFVDVNSGAWYATLNNCALVGNSTSYAGGAAYSTGHNSIAYYNTGSASASSANWYGGTVSFCCVTPLAAGPGNFTNAPLFADTNGWSNLRLQSNSPCINAGRNLDAPGAVWTAVLRTNYPWQAGTMIWTEPNAGSPGAAFYRLGAGQGE